MNDIESNQITAQIASSILESIRHIYKYTSIVNLEDNTYRNIFYNNKVHSSNMVYNYEDAIKFFSNHYIHPDDIPTFLAFTSRENIIAKLNMLDYIEFEFREKINGGYEWIRVEIIPACSGKDIKNVIIAGNIVTAQKEKELKNKEALKTAYLAADRATKSKSKFLKNMSHDIRTPINAILGMCTMAAAYSDNQTKLSECINKISIAGEHLLKLINNILDMSCIEDGNTIISPEPFDLETELNNLISLIQPEMDNHGHTFITDISDLNHDIVNSDMLKLQQILINVLSNAAKYTPNNGQILFIVNRRPTGSDDLCDYEFIIRDNGIGIAPENLEKIFEPFYRSDDALNNSIDGTGLGLSIVQNLIKLMNGNIYVNSEPGKGTKFTILLPMVLAKCEAAATVETPTAQSQIVDLIHSHDYTGKRILVAEDNSINAEIVTEFLSGSGVSLSYARTGLEAINMFGDNPRGYFDAILMDVQMPYVNGYEATQNIRNDVLNGGDTIPIIAMTANAFSSDVKDAKNAGMNEHMSKPIDIKVLYSVLDKYISNQH